ncbi:MAG: DUF4867 family protein [Gammaproteobacteria bacterium]|nr:DUF4867 family protein [Gammaproteobacteria bacterium]
MEDLIMKTTQDNEFKNFGKVLKNNTDEIIEYLNTSSPMPEDGTIYVANDDAFLNLPSVKLMEKKYFNEPMEAGYCNGYNRKMNCLEWHGCIEINVANEDIILLLGQKDDIVDDKIDSSKVTPFLIKKGQMISLYPGVLHFAPIQTSEKGFKCAVLLTMGTNEDLKRKSKDKFYFKNNKWLIAHEEAKQAQMGAVVGITGKNLEF